MEREQSLNAAISSAPHQCMIAEIRFDDTPIPDGAISATSDKLAQRDIAWIDGPNPGVAPSRVMPHPFEIRASASASAVDELMINWGNTPAHSTGSLYLPAVRSSRSSRLPTPRIRSTSSPRSIPTRSAARPPG